MRLACLSVDLDEIPCYSAIHGLPAPSSAASGGAETAIYDKALPRFLRLFEDEGVPATFFAIGSDLEGARAEHNGGLLKEAIAAGHEIANHSHHHLYDLTRRDRATQRAEVQGGIEVIEAATGERPVGFRAPGYTITDELFSVLSELGVEYDSSVFPCPAYYGAKASAIGWIALRGRRSHSVLDDPRVLTAPADPYRVGRPYWSRDRSGSGRSGGLLELPIGVSRGPRLPYIGTFVALAGRTGARWMSKASLGRPLINLEMHGIDLSDRDRDGLQFLAPHQPDLRKSARDKELAIREAISVLREGGYRFVTLREAAREFG